MRTPKCGGTKRTPPAKKDPAATAAASSDNTPEAAASTATVKSTPKSGSGAKAAKSAGKRPTPKNAAAAAGAPSAVPAAAPATPNPLVPAAGPAAEGVLVLKSDEKVQETMTPAADSKLSLAAKSPEKLDAEAMSTLPSHIEASAARLPVVELKDVKNESAMKSVELGTPPPPMEVDERGRPVVVSNERKEPETPEKGEETVDGIKKEEGESLADLEAKSGSEESLIKKEEESAGKVVAVEAEEHAMEEDVEQGGADGHGDEEAEKDEEEAGGLKEEEQAEMLDMIKERKKKKEQEIFVGGLDRDATEDDVRKAFEKIGVVEGVRLHKDFTTNQNKGFAFVKFADKEQASRAVSELKNPIIRGKRCGIAPSEDNDTLFLGNICNTWTKEAIKRRLKDYGIEGVDNITVVEDTQNEGLSRGFAFLEFSCHEYAMDAYKRLQKPDVVFGHAEWTTKVAFAEPLREPDPEIMAQVKSVFVDGMPAYWDEDRVKEHFKEYGEIEGIALARNMPTAKRRDFGFVNCATHDPAVACADAVNNTELGDGKSKMTNNKRSRKVSSHGASSSGSSHAFPSSTTSPFFSFTTSPAFSPATTGVGTSRSSSSSTFVPSVSSPTLPFAHIAPTPFSASTPSTSSPTILPTLSPASIVSASASSATSGTTHRRGRRSTRAKIIRTWRETHGGASSIVSDLRNRVAQLDAEIVCLKAYNLRMQAVYRLMYADLKCSIYQQIRDAVAAAVPRILEIAATHPHVPSPLPPPPPSTGEFNEDDVGIQEGDIHGEDDDMLHLDDDSDFELDK